MTLGDIALGGLDNITKLEPAVGIEPTATELQAPRSATELSRQFGGDGEN